MAKKVSRRDFLKLAGATSAGLALSACGVQAMEVPTPTSTSTLIPSTQTPTPTSTYIPTATSIPNTLRGYADALGFNIGVVAETNGFNEALISREFNEIAVSSIGWEVIDQKKESAYDFSIPDWLKSGSFSRDELIEIMKKHIRKVMSHYKGQVRSYTVVNEASEPSIFWNRHVGPEYVEIAFQTAREADPDAVLIYNDSGHETARLPKSNQVFNLVKSLKAKDLVDAVGFQMHILGEPDSYIDPRTPPTKEELLEQMSRYGDMGVKVFITELDVDTGKLSGTKEEKWSKQAEIYGTVVEACLESSGICKDINMWGISDIDAWRGEAPFLYTASNQPKPAYFAVLDILKRYYDAKK